MRSRAAIPAAVLIPTLLLASGCRSTHLSARSLPPEMLAPSGAGRQQIELRNMASMGDRSAAIGPADLLEVQVVTGLADEAAEPTTARVRDDGAVEIPYVGPVAVAGLEPTAAAALIARAAVERGVYLRPQVQVRVAEQATHRVTVLGAVTEPGVHEVPRGGCDVLSAIAVAGGFTEEAGAVVEVLRHGTPASFANAEGEGAEIRQASFDAPDLSGGSAPVRTERIDLSEAGAVPLSEQRLADRDVVVVRPREKRVVHVSGLVQTPDQLELTEDHDLRVLDAVAMAGGVTSSVADKALLVRRVEGRDEPVVVQLSLAKAKRDGAENLVLQSGDLISVERTAATTVLDALNTFFRVTMGIGGNLTLF